MNLDGVVPLGYCGVLYQLGNIWFGLIGPIDHRLALDIEVIYHIGNIWFGLLGLINHRLALDLEVFHHHPADVCST